MKNNNNLYEILAMLIFGLAFVIILFSMFIYVYKEQSDRELEKLKLQLEIEVLKQDVENNTQKCKQKTISYRSSNVMGICAVRPSESLIKVWH